MREITLNCRDMSQIAQFHDALCRELAFPDSYGRNYDALHDLLTALTVPTHLELQALDSAGFPTVVLRRVLLDCAAENPRFTVSF